MSMLWWFDLIPDMSAFTPASKPNFRATSSKKSVKLVVYIESVSVKEGELTFQIEAPSGYDDGSLTTVLSQEVKLNEGLAEFVVSDLINGTYVGLAFMDINKNGVLDLDAQGRPTEPFAAARQTTPAPERKLGPGVFVISSSEPVFVHLNLR